MMGTQSPEMSTGNKHTKKNCAPSWLYLQHYLGTRGQQNIKKYTVIPRLTSDPVNEIFG